MFRPFVAMVLLGISITNLGLAQLSGSRGGLSGGSSVKRMQPYSSHVAQSYIAIDGQSCLDVEPTRIRIVLAITAEGATSTECRVAVDERITRLRSALMNAGVKKKDLSEDFISVVPEFDFAFEKRNDAHVAVEKNVGYLMQSNVHVSVADDAEAMKVVHVAFQNGVSDIIGFDYWNDSIDEKKKLAREEALKAAKAKADSLLQLFEDRPPVINIQEETVVKYPKSMYVSFENVASHGFQRRPWNLHDLPVIREPRPKNTYYRGSIVDADTDLRQLPMAARISVVSTVRIYYESPAARRFNTGRHQD